MSQGRTALRLARQLRAGRIASRFASTSAGEATSSPSSSSLIESWQRPIPEGAIPAYDFALKYLDEHSGRLTSRADRLRARSQGKSGAEARSLAESADALELKAKLSDPRVRWAFEESGGRTAVEEEKAVFSSLAREKWVNEGGRDLLMQRITTMNIVPDLLPFFSPPEAMTIAYPAAEHERLTEVVPGEYLLPSQTVEPPTISIQSFRTPAQAPRFNTLVMVDADRPDPASNGFVQYVHWIVPNIRVDASTTELPLSELPALLPYHPPHPSVATPYHRYAFFLLQQPSELPLSSLQTPTNRASFNLREWVRASSFKGEVQEVVRAASLFREGGKRFGEAELKGREMLDLVAKQEGVVANIYQDVLGTSVPIWKKAPKEVKYGTAAEKASATKRMAKLSA